MIASIPSTIQDNINYLMQSIHQQNTHRHVATSSSTNSELMNQITTEQLSATQVHMLTADTQTHGRGQNGRSWQSPKGNVYLSLFYPKYHPLYSLNMPISGLLSLCVGYSLSKLEVLNLLNKQLDNPIGVKWANDIGFYQKQGKAIVFNKLSGILIEPVIRKGNLLGVVVGVGLNVNNAPKLCNIKQEGMGYQSVSIAELIKTANHQNMQADGSDGRYPKATDLYRPICKQILKAILCHQHITQLNNNNQLSNNNALQDFLAHFAKADVLKGRTLSISSDLRDKTTALSEELNTNQATYIAKAVGIDKQGCLQIQKDDGKVMRLFSAKIQVLA